MQQEFIFKKNIFGGFNRRQVIDCIEKLQGEHSNTVSDKELSDIKNTLKIYTENLGEKNRIIQELKAKLNEAYEAAALPDTQKTIGNAEKIILQAKSTAEQITKKTEVTVEAKRIKSDKLLSNIILINEETERIKKELTEVMVKLSEIAITDCPVNKEVKPIQHDEAVVPEKSSSDKNTIEDIDEYLNRTEENFNSIDNFFAELYKMTNGKLFEPRKIPENITPDDFEYEY